MPVTGLDVQIRRLLANGKIFGDVGAYEEIRGVIRFAVDPLHSNNHRVTDIARAPRDKNGRVAFESDIVILRGRSIPYRAADASCSMC